MGNILVRFSLRRIYVDLINLGKEVVRWGGTARDSCSYLRMRWLHEFVIIRSQQKARDVSGLKLFGPRGLLKCGTACLWTQFTTLLPRCEKYRGLEGQQALFHCTNSELVNVNLLLMLRCS